MPRRATTKGKSQFKTFFSLEGLNEVRGRYIHDPFHRVYAEAGNINLRKYKTGFFPFHSSGWKWWIVFRMSSVPKIVGVSLPHPRRFFFISARQKYACKQPLSWVLWRVVQKDTDDGKTIFWQNNLQVSDTRKKTWGNWNVSAKKITPVESGLARLLLLMIRKAKHPLQCKRFPLWNCGIARDNFACENWGKKVPLC